MEVTLNTSDQFGPEGPQTGAQGICEEIRLVDGEYWALIYYTGKNIAWTPLHMIMHVDPSLGVPTTEADGNFLQP